MARRLRVFASFSQEATLMTEEIVKLSGRQMQPLNLPFCLDFEGPLDPARVGDALAAFVDRHSALRTALGPNPEVPAIERNARLQVFAFKHLNAPGLFQQTIFEHVDRPHVQIIDSEEQDPAAHEQVRKFIREGLSVPFDYAAPPLLRAALVRLYPERHLLLLIASGLVFDLWSFRTLHLELPQLYDGTPLSEPAMPFHEFSQQQFSRARSGAYRAAAEYWRKQWRQYADASVWYRSIPFAHPLPSQPAFESESQRLAFDPEFSARMRKCANACGANMRSMVLAAFLAVLRDVTVQFRIAVTMAFRNRSGEGREIAVGCVANMHSVGFDVNREDGPAAILHATHQRLSEAERAEEPPPIFLWNHLSMFPRSSDLMVTFHFISATGLSRVQTAEGTVVRARPFPSVGGVPSGVGLSIFAVDQDEGLTIAMSYSRDRFADADIDSTLKQLRRTFDWTMNIPGMILDTEAAHAGY